MDHPDQVAVVRKPAWLKVRYPSGPGYTETLRVARLQKKVRSGARWERSVFVLSETKKQGTMLVKTGIQVGHGETWDELLGVMDDLAAIGLSILTIGQYLQPTREHLPVRRYYTPEEFATLRDEAKRRGVRYVQSGPLVRSSYRAEEPFEGGA